MSSEPLSTLVNNLRVCLADILKHELLQSAAGQSEAPDAKHKAEEALYYRSLNDYVSMQRCLCEALTFLTDKEQFIDTLTAQGDRVESATKVVAFTEQLDEGLEHLVNLMQFSDPSRAQWNVKNGFTLKSGSMNYGRWYFNQSNDLEE